MEMSDLLKSVVKGLNDEQKEKVKACKSPDEVIACLGELGVELPDELLDAVAGGISWSDFLDEWFERQVELELAWGVDMWDFKMQSVAEHQAYDEMKQKYAGELPPEAQ